MLYGIPNEYTKAVRSVVCPQCKALANYPCDPTTSAVVHPIRRTLAIKMGKWNVEEAHARALRGELVGCPLEALKPE